MWRKPRSGAAGAGIVNYRLREVSKKLYDNSLNNTRLTIAGCNFVVRSYPIIQWFLLHDLSSDDHHNHVDRDCDCTGCDWSVQRQAGDQDYCPRYTASRRSRHASSQCSRPVQDLWRFPGWSVPVKKAGAKRPFSDRVLPQILSATASP